MKARVLLHTRMHVRITHNLYFGHLGIAVTGGAAINNFMATIPGPFSTFEEILGFAVCAYYIPKYVGTAEGRKSLKSELSQFWITTVGSEPPATLTDKPKPPVNTMVIPDGSEDVTDIIRKVAASYNANLSPNFKSALVNAIQRLREEDLQYREDYKVLLEEFDLLTREKEELLVKIGKLEAALEKMDLEYVKAKDLIVELKATITSLENEADAVLKSSQAAAEAAQNELKELLKERKHVEDELERVRAKDTGELEAQIKALKSRLGEALDAQEMAQQKFMEAEKTLLETKNDMEKKISDLNSQLAIARLLEQSREKDTENLALQLDMLVDEELAAVKEIGDSLEEDIITAAATLNDVPPSSFSSTESAPSGKAKASSENATQVSSVRKGGRPLSKMNKKELQAECEMLGLDVSGKVPELRVRIRTARSAAKSIDMASRDR
mmetsp:Transcript_28206/g.39231  ORF Transcript_28206/g.39231 Transcript_28206/m.39231 type:complete len:441 (+) Transcript_28206:2-1324(+)